MHAAIFLDLSRGVILIGKICTMGRGCNDYRQNILLGSNRYGPRPLRSDVGDMYEPDAVGLFEAVVEAVED